jgi:RHS repeat-associated protein
MDRGVRVLAGVLAGALVISLAPAVPAAAAPARPAEVTAAAPTRTATPADPLRAEKVAAIQQARRSGHRVEITGLRGEASTTWANPDGTFTSHLSAGPERVKTAQGWRDIDPTLVADAGGVHPKVVVGTLRLSAGGDRALLRATLPGGRRLGLDWPSVLPSPTLHADTATYPGVVAGGDLVVQALSGGFELSLVLRQRPAPGALEAVRLGLSGDASVGVDAARGGGLRIRDGAGRLLAAGPPPVMFGAAMDRFGQPARSAKLDMTVAPASGGNDKPALVLAPDAGFLADPAVAYPVTIDPTLSWLPASDTYIQQSNPSTNFNGSTQLVTGTSNGGGDRARSLVTFDTSPVAGTHIVSATLHVFNFQSSVCSTSNSNTLNVHRVTSAWNPATVTWSSGAPSWSNTVSASSARSYQGTTGCPGAYIDLDLTSVVALWASGTVGNWGVMLRAFSEVDNAGFRKFYSKDHAGARPSMDVTYSTPDSVDKRSMTPGDSADTGTVTPTLHGVYTDLESGNGHVDFEVANPATGAVVASGAGATVASGADSTWAVPAGSLAANSTYRWRARGNNGVAGPWSAYKYFNTQAASLLGAQRRFGFEGRTLNDRSDLGVNVANGDLLLHATDLRIRGTGLDFSLDRYYNSRQPGVSALGKGWTLGVGQDVKLLLAASNPTTSDVTYVAPTGFTGRFSYDNTVSPARWRHPPGVDADLTWNATTGEWKLAFQKSEGKFFFNSTGRFVREEDRNNNTIRFDYNPQGLLSTVTDTQNRLTTLSYVGGRLDTVTDPSNRTVHYTYTADGNLETVTDAGGGNPVRYRYNADLLIDQVTTGGNSITRIDYVDAGGKVTDFSTQFESGFGVPTSATTSFAYGVGETKVTDPNGNFTTTDPTDGITTYRFDDRDRITKVIDALGHTQDNTYTSTDNIARLTDGLQKQAILSWDVNDENLTSTALPTGAKTQFDYTPSSPHPHAVTQTTDPQGNTLTYTYDSAGNLDITSQAGVTLEDRDYNANGTISKITDGNNNATLFGYDPKGNLTSVDNPAPLGDLTLTPDALSRLHTLVDGKNQTTTYTYDPLDRPDVTTYQDNSTVDNNYDPDGNLIQVTDATGITVFDYNKMNWQIRKTLPDNTQLRYDYDHNGNLALFTDPGGDVTYTYDQANRLTQLLEPGASTPVTFGYDNDNRRTTTTYPTTPTATVMTTGYDDAGKLTSVKATVGATTLSSFTYSYQKNGADTALRQSMTDPAGTTSYTYDTRNRLTGASGPGLSRTYGYDNNSNRTSKTEGGTTTNYGYNAANELCWSGPTSGTSCTVPSGNTSYTYDPNGNLTGSSSGWSLAYNPKDQTTSITKPGGTALAPMAYAGGSQTQRTQAGQASFVNSALGVASATSSGSTTFYTRDSRGTLVSLRTASGNRYYYLFDGLGSVVGLVNSSGSKVNAYSYDPYGVQLSATEAVANPWRYVSGFFDAQTGLTKFGTRYYDPTLGRFTQRDPISPTFANYRYAGCDPVNRIDPLGTQEIPPILYDECDPIRTFSVNSWEWRGDVLWLVKRIYDKYTLKLCDVQDLDALDPDGPPPPEEEPPPEDESKSIIQSAIQTIVDLVPMIGFW